MRTLVKHLVGFFNGIWKVLIGLGPSQSINTLSENELYEFYRDLGYEVFSAVLLLWVVAFMTTTSVAEGALNGLLLTSVCVVVFLLLFKVCWRKHKLSITERTDEVYAKFHMEDNSGLLDYELRTYLLSPDDFCLWDNKLFQLSLLLEDEDCGKSHIKSWIYYSDEADKFFKVTRIEVEEDEVNPSYKVISWIFFSVCLLSIAWLIIGSLVILL